MKSAFIDIFSHVVEFSPSMVREYVLQESQRQDDVSLRSALVTENTEYVLIQAHALIDADAPAAKKHITSNSHQMLIKHQKIIQKH